MKILSLFAAAALCCSTSIPAIGQDAFNTTADTGQMGGFDNGPTDGNFYGGAGKTTNQGDQLGLPGTVTSAPVKGGGNCPGNFALKQLGKNTLPPTKLNSLVKDGGEAVFGGDGVLLPRYFTFDESHRMERAMEKNPDLTTNHKIGSPSAWDFPK
jgi:hypothetical protein